MFSLLADPTMKSIAYLVGHSFVTRFCRRAARDGKSIGKLAGLGEAIELFAHRVSVGTFADTLACPDDLLRRIDELPRMPEVFVFDLGTNDLCSRDASPKVVVENAMALVDLLRRQYRTLSTVVFMSVVQRTFKGRYLEMSLRSYNRKVKLFNQMLAAKVKQIRGVFFIVQAINHPRYICGDGCHLTDEGVTRYGSGIRRAVLMHRNG